MESKQFTQFGTFTVIIMSALLIVFAGLLIKHGFSADQETFLYTFLIVISLICLLTFYKLTIIVDNATVSFKLGFGIFSKSYNISEIASCKPVKNLWIYGVGIHKIPNGWLYNASGLKAIELRFRNTDKIIRIGTNKPDEIVKVISGLMTKNQNSEDENSSSRNSNSKSKNTYIAVSIVIAITIAFNIYEYQSAKIELHEKYFEITGIYGFPINYNDISSIDTISQLPNIETKTNGFAAGKVCKGYFRLTNVGNASLFINFSVSPFVQMVLKNGRVVYFNLKDRQSTIETFDKIKLKDKLNSTKLIQPSK